MSFLESIGIHYDPNIIVQLGVILSVTFLGSKIFQRVGIPQVVGFISLGVILGNSVLNIIPLEAVDQFSIITLIALGLIGFDMGSHLRFQELRKLGRSIIFILLFEALGTFVLVTAGIYLITETISTALVFGALASATAPAATVDVLAEYDAKGPLTTTLIAVVGLDDAVSLVLFSVAAALSESMLVGNGVTILSDIILIPIIEIVGSILLGLVLGFILDFILKRIKRQHDAMAISIGAVLLCVGLADALGFSLILACMVLGLIVVNRTAEHGQHIRYTVEQAGPVIYVLFFALVGARFQVQLLPTMGLIGVVYIILRSLGKFSGAWLGGRVGRAEPAVKNNLGFGLLSQAGVAIGLATESYKRFCECGEAGVALGTLVISVITATTFVVQLIGPIFVKLAIRRADEIGKARESDSVWASEGSPE
jgi:NhaP-type Na+/H+ or K+/H+ antiporter